MSSPPTLFGSPSLSSFSSSSSSNNGEKTILPSTRSLSNPCLDFFFQVVPTTPTSAVSSLLAASWHHDPLTSLKLLCNLRGVRGTGKSDKQGFYAAALWLHDHHPKTLALNLASFAEFGYMKDLLGILHRLIHGPDARKPVVKKPKFKKQIRRKSKKERRVGTVNELIMIELKKLNLWSESQFKGKLEKKRILAERALRLYVTDENYRFLHDQVAEFFAGRLLSDLEQLKQGNVGGIGVAAKWCPSLDSSYDRSTLICVSIAQRMWPKDSEAEYRDLEDEHYVYRVRNRLRQEVLVPIRKVLELPEVYMSARQWDSLSYDGISSVAIKNYAKIFKKHDEVRFLQCLEQVKEGKGTIAAGALLPHEIVASAKDSETAEVAELLWQRMVRDLSEKGKLTNCIAVCDVSGWLSGAHFEAGLALAVLVSELSEEPWKGRVITFSSKPELHKIIGETVTEKMKFVKNMEKGLNANFQMVFDRLLEVAIAGNVCKEKMIKRVFVFSQMNFDEASENKWETDYEAICRKFEEKGYGSCVPEIVFWNLGAPRWMPVSASQNGVALVSGFSKNLVKIFVERDGEMSPESIMEDAISGEEYQKLVVFD